MNGREAWELSDEQFWAALDAPGQRGVDAARPGADRTVVMIMTPEGWEKLPATNVRVGAEPTGGTVLGVAPAAIVFYDASAPTPSILTPWRALACRAETWRDALRHNAAHVARWVAQAARARSARRRPWRAGRS